NEEILATFGDQSVFLMLTTCGAGSLAVLNADLGATNLTAEPAFVPLIGELVKLLIGRGSISTPAFCGESSVQILPTQVAQQDALDIVPPEGSTATSTFSIESVGVAWHLLDPNVPGIYEVRQRDEPVYALAVNIPPQECDLDALEPEVLTGRLAAGREVRYFGAGEQSDPVDRGWIWLAGGALCCVVLELVVLRATRN
ncbi:MAG: hypothetical protein AB7U73_18400, partial [Pirellulales bacterium]